MAMRSFAVIRHLPTSTTLAVVGRSVDATLATYAYPLIGGLAVGTIDTKRIMGDRRQRVEVLLTPSHGRQFGRVLDAEERPVGSSAFEGQQKGAMIRWHGSGDVRYQRRARLDESLDN